MKHVLVLVSISRRSSTKKQNFYYLIFIKSSQVIWKSMENWKMDYTDSAVTLRLKTLLEPKCVFICKVGTR